MKSGFECTSKKQRQQAPPLMITFIFFIMITSVLQLYIPIVIVLVIYFLTLELLVQSMNTCIHRLYQEFQCKEIDDKDYHNWYVKLQDTCYHDKEDKCNHQWRCLLSLLLTCTFKTRFHVSKHGQNIELKMHVFTDCTKSYNLRKCMTRTAKIGM